MILNLDHIAIAVPELDAAIRQFSEDLGLVLESVEDVPSASTRTAFFPVSDPVRATRVELVSPLGGDGPLVDHLDRRGPGLHHLCFRTDALEQDMRRLKEKGYQFTSTEPMEGAHGTKVAFLHPRSTGGVLIELAEYPGERDG